MDHDPLDIREQERAKADNATRDRLTRENEEADTKWLMSSKRGRRIVWRLLDRCGVFRLSFSTNAIAMAFAEGNRNVGNGMLATIHSVCPELYPTMLKEQRNGRGIADSARNEAN